MSGYALSSLLAGAGISIVEHSTMVWSRCTRRAARHRALLRHRIYRTSSTWLKSWGLRWSTSRPSRIRGAAQEAPSPFGGNNPGEEFWQRFFGGRASPWATAPKRHRFRLHRRGNGTILTNYHVVDGAQKLVVTLSDGKNYEAKVIGKDQKSDMAVIKIEAGRELARGGSG